MQTTSAVDFLEWSELLFPFDFEGTRRMVMLASYHDRSTTSDDGVPIYAVGGYISTNLKWHFHFCGPWKKVMDENGLDFFHMTDFENREEPYADWDNTRRERVITSLLDIIGNTAVLGVGGAVVLPDYENLSREQKAILGTPYHLCSMWCVREIRKWLEEKRETLGVAYVFDHGDVGKGEVQAGLEEAATRSDKTHVLSVTFASKERFPQLQAADIVAYETSKSTLRMAGLSSRPKTRKSLARLLERVEHRGGFFDKEKFPLLIAELQDSIAKDS